MDGFCCCKLSIRKETDKIFLTRLKMGSDAKTEEEFKKNGKELQSITVLYLTGVGGLRKVSGKSLIFHGGNKDELQRSKESM